MYCHRFIKKKNYKEKLNHFFFWHHKTFCVFIFIFFHILTNQVFTFSDFDQSEMESTETGNTPTPHQLDYTGNNKIVKITDSP